jgi:hypothetical protein
MLVKKLVLVGLMSLVLLGTLTLPVFSNDPHTLDAKVTPFNLAISLDATTADFGTLELSQADNDRTTRDSGVINVTNVGSSDVKLVIHGSNATPDQEADADWTLDCSDDAKGAVDVNQFAIRFAIGSAPFWDVDGASLCPGSDKTLKLVLESGGQTPFVLQMNMPTSTTGYSERSSAVVVTAMKSD